MKPEDCCTVTKNRYYFDPESGQSVYGDEMHYCKSPDCHKKPCINFRVGQAFGRFKDAFGDDEVYYKDFDKCDSVTYKDIITIGQQYFKHVLVLDCFTFFRLIVSDHKKGMDITKFIHIKNIYRFLKRSFELCKVSPDEFDDETGGRRIFYRNITKNIPEKRIPSLDNHFARPQTEGIVKEHHKKVKFISNSEVKFKIYDLDSRFKEIDINQALQNEHLKWFVETIHGFDFNHYM